jgi:hypothetical protein
MSKSTDRHKREKLSKIADSVNLSAESVRRGSIVMQVLPDGEQLMASGEHSINKLYKLASGDARVGIHIQVQPELRELLKIFARARHMTLNDFIVHSLVDRYVGLEE